MCVQCCPARLTILFCEEKDTNRERQNLQVLAYWVYMCFFSWLAAGDDVSKLLPFLVLSAMYLYWIVLFVKFWPPSQLDGVKYDIMAVFDFSPPTSVNSTWSTYYSRLRFSFPYTWLCGNPAIARYLHLAPVFPSLLEAVGQFVMHLQMNLDFFPVSLLLPSIFMTLRSSETLTAANTTNQIMLQIRSRVRNSSQFKKSEIKKALHSCRRAPLFSENDSAFQVSHSPGWMV